MDLGKVNWKPSGKDSPFEMLLGLLQWLSRWRICLWCRRPRRLEFDPWVGKIPWRKKWQPTPVFLPAKFHGQRSLVTLNIINRSLEEADSKPLGWLWGVQDIRERESNCRCGGNSKRIRSGAWNCDWFCCNLMINFNRWGVASHGWAKRVVSWDGIYSWWRCCDDYWNDNKRF